MAIADAVRSTPLYKLVEDDLREGGHTQGKWDPVFAVLLDKRTVFIPDPSASSALISMRNRASKAGYRIRSRSVEYQKQPGKVLWLDEVQ
jgi:hypothetical protein